MDIPLTWSTPLGPYTQAYINLVMLYVSPGSAKFVMIFLGPSYVTTQLPRTTNDLLLEYFEQFGSCTGACVAWCRTP